MIASFAQWWYDWSGAEFLDKLHKALSATMLWKEGQKVEGPS